MSSRVVKQQLADLQQTSLSTEAPTRAAGVKKRKLEKALKKAAVKVPAKNTVATKKRNLEYFLATTGSEQAAATAAIMEKVNSAPVFTADHLQQPEATGKTV